jgi:hypothetical protein
MSWSWQKASKARLTKRSPKVANREDKFQSGKAIAMERSDLLKFGIVRIDPAAAKNPKLEYG